MGTVACTCCYFQLKGSKPPLPQALIELSTLGDHLRKTRLDRNLSQPKVAKIFGVATDSVTYWETNRHQPTMKEASKIIQFLGYFPFEWEHEPLHIKVKFARMVAGHTLKQMGKEIQIDSSTLYKILIDKSVPKNETLQKIHKYINQYLASKNSHID